MEKQVIKLQEEEIKKFKDLRNSYNDMIIQIGQFELQIHDLTKALKSVEEQKEKLKEKYEQSKSLERQYINDLYKKYGEGELNLDKGEIIKIENPQEKTEENKDKPLS